MKKTIVLFAVMLSVLMIFGAREIWSQNDWSGGEGQLQMSDSTMYYEKGSTVPDVNITLDWFSDTVWTKLSSYPTQGAEFVNDFMFVNDTLYGATGLKGLVSYSLTYGDNWTEMDTFPVNQSSVEALSINMIDNVLYATGYYGGVNKGFVYRSFDRQTWDTTCIQPTGFADRVYDVVQMNGDTFLATAGNPDATYANMDGQVLKSIDACSTWVKSDTLSFALISSIGKVNDSTAVVAKDGFLGNGILAITYDNGETWTNYTNPFGAELGVALYVDEANNFVYTGDWYGNLFRTDIDDANWTMLDTTGAIDSTMMIMGITYIDSAMYITTAYPGNLYRSYDNGYTVELVTQLTSLQLTKLDKMGPHTYGIASADTTDGGRLYYSSYHSEGFMNSSVFDMDSITSVPTTPLYAYAWGNAPRRTSAGFKIRTGNNADMSDAELWNNCPVVTTVNGSEIDLTGISSVDTTHRYMQYRVELSTTVSKELSPQFDSITVHGDYLGIGDVRDIADNISIERTGGNVFRIINNTGSAAGITVYNLTGSSVYREDFVPGEHQFTLNLPSGRYFMSTDRDLKNKTEAFILLR